MAVKKRPTVRDVAERADVSFKTVSRVVNREGGVRPELVARVEASVAALGYRPNHGARLLRQTTSQATTIGFVLVDVGNAFFSALLRGIEEVATAHDCMVLAGSTGGSEEREHQLIEGFVGRRVDGLIVVSLTSGTGPLDAEIARGTPLVFLDTEPDLAEVDLVRSDHYAGAAAATEHLLDGGHKDIAYFGDDPAVYSAGLRKQAFGDTMKEAGLEVPAHRILTGSYTQPEWRKIVVEHLQSNPHPTAVFSAQNYVTVGVVQALHDLGLHHQIALVGFDDLELANVVDPAITVIPQRPDLLGRLAAEILFARIGGDESPCRREVIAAELIERGSGEIRPSW